jgi:SARP family transcriptional regulator, regulator of embCAB operon
LVELRILGPVEVCAGEDPVQAGEPRRLAVLAALAVDAGQVVPAGTLIDRVWGEEPPAQALARAIHDRWRVVTP